MTFGSYDVILARNMELIDVYDFERHNLNFWRKAVKETLFLS